MSGIDWGAIARAASAAAALPKGGLFSNLSHLNLGNASTNNSPTGAHDSTWTTTGTVPGADGLTGPLTMPNNLPQGVGAGSKFTWSIDDTGAHTRQITQMTLAGSLSWLRDLATTNARQYNEIVQGLVQAGYLTPADARYGAYTNKVATAFLQSAIDVEQINNDQGGGGAVTTWWNHIDALVQGRKDSGQLNPDGTAASGSGSGGIALPTAPTRTDVYTNPEDVKTAINNAARNVLGRHLTPDEEAQFAAQFHAQEKTFNDQQWGQQWADYQQKLTGAGPANNTNPATAPDAVGRPSVSDSATNYMDTSPNLQADREQSLLGSYIGILRNITGLGSGGISSAVR